MKNLVQIIYISRSTFLNVGNSQNEMASIEPDVANILSKSRTNNFKTGLVGVLFFGDGCFFECLEGEESEIDKLYQILSNDSRHKDLKILAKKNISHLSFKKWLMKYVPFDADIKQLLHDNGYSSFDPYAFDATMIAKVLDLLRVAKEPIDNKLLKSSQNYQLTKWAIFLPVFALTVYLLKLVYFVTVK